MFVFDLECLKVRKTDDDFSLEALPRRENEPCVRLNKI